MTENHTSGINAVYLIIFFMVAMILGTPDLEEGYV